LFSPAFKLDHPEVVEEIIERYSNFSGDSLVQYYEAMMDRPDRTDILKKSIYPVLFIAGEHDTAIPLDHVMQQSHLPSLSYIHVLKHSGHMGMLEEQELSNQFLREFLTGI
jgi:pimeloyl-ACP methyl ester carboxylesterase